MGWVWLAGIGIVAAGLLWRLGTGRQLWMFAGAALMLGAAGYALQGRPLLAAHPVLADADPEPPDPGGIELRDAMIGKFTGDTAYLVASDAMRGVGDRRAAVQVILGGIHAFPDSLALWVGLGDALADHDGGQVSPPALFAFQQAARLSPNHPAPPFFLGTAYVRSGNLAAARFYWARALALSPAKASYRPEIAFRLQLLDRLLAMQEAGPAPQ